MKMLRKVVLSGTLWRRNFTSGPHYKLIHKGEHYFFVVLNAQNIITVALAVGISRYSEISRKLCSFAKKEFDEMSQISFLTKYEISSFRQFRRFAKEQKDVFRWIPRIWQVLYKGRSKNINNGRFHSTVQMLQKI